MYKDPILEEIHLIIHRIILNNRGNISIKNSWVFPQGQIYLIIEESAIG